MVELSELLAAASRRSAREERGEPRKSPPDVLCVTLRETADRYAAPCPFKVGDLVTPRVSGPYSGAGEPHIVVEVPDTPIRNFETRDSRGGVFSCDFGSRLDVRVACEMGGSISAFWQESWQLEPYTGPDAGRDAA